MFTKTKAVGLMLSLFSANAMALVVTPTTDGSLLANTILGSGITISNVNYVGAANSSGTFTDGLSSGIGMDEGIILTSGNATLAPGPNDQSGATGNNGLPGDVDLNGLNLGTSLDASVLTFDFVSAGGDLFFDFVFASEEYNEYLSFIDPFGLFVDGVNYALAPDGQEISVGTVNCGPSGAGIGPNCGTFNNNSNGDLGTYDIQYDGFSDVYTASVLGLSAGSHSMKIAISDANDMILDSAVFIQAGSFTDKPPEEGVPEPGILALLGLGLAGMTLVRRRKRV